MHSTSDWQHARPPNYHTNFNRLYHYSEVPFLGQYNWIKIPLLASNLIDHVDYWGEGKIETSEGISGFANSYNVNHTYQLVSNGPDRHRKIPNRVPVISYTNCDTSHYIRDNSVILVTVMGAPINKSCAADIARIVNNDLGQVVIFGFESNSEDVNNLTIVLKCKDLYHCPDYKLPFDLQGLTLFNNHMVFLNVGLLKEELYKFIIDGKYDMAVYLTKNLKVQDALEKIINDVIQKLFDADDGQERLCVFAHKLRRGGAKDVVKKYFPTSFKMLRELEQGDSEMKIDITDKVVEDSHLRKNGINK